jgi:preprotein translocase subunit SecD
VIIFLLVVYRFMGIIAVLGLGIYAVLMYGAILLLNVTLTLPGFAGLILTIGVAATRTSSSSSASRKKCGPGSPCAPP